MQFWIDADTEQGRHKAVNQDSYFAKTVDVDGGPVVFAVLCDGMGGLSNGELASSSATHAFADWFGQQMVRQGVADMEDNTIRTQWEEIIERLNRTLGQYGQAHGLRMGTTAMVFLLTQRRYYLLLVGDTRVYEFAKHSRCLTTDQTVLARELARGTVSQREARGDPRGSILLQCVGASKEVCPAFYFGTPQENAVYLLCSDGFRRMVEEEELYNQLSPQHIRGREHIQPALREVIRTNQQRGEEDDMSAILIRTV